MKQFEVLKWASSFLEKHQKEQTIADILLQHHLHVNRSQFYMNMQAYVPEDILKKYEADIKRHVETDIPVQHLTGYEYFFGRRYDVNENVLIPRQETEELVAYAIQIAKEKYSNEQITIADIGTGSGVIATTLALELDDPTVYAIDISAEALTIAKRNANKLGASINFLQGDFLKPLIVKNIKAHIVISNPPYINQSDVDMLSRTVKDYDPALALFAEENGLAAYRKIINDLKEVTFENSTVIFEIGYDQGKAVSGMLSKAYPESDVEVIKDINGKDRIVVCHV